MRLHFIQSSELPLYGGFTLIESKTETGTNKKWVVQNMTEVFTLHLDSNAIEYCYNLSDSVSGSVSLRIILSEFSTNLFYF